VNWDRLLQQLSEAVHYNGYVALKNSSTSHWSHRKMKALLEETTAAMHSSIKNRAEQRTAGRSAFSSNTE